MIPFFGCKREFKEYEWEYLRLFHDVMASGQLLQGDYTRQFEEDLADFVGVGHAVAVGSCTDALFFALKALNVQPGDKILVPAFSFVASVSPILRIGAIPVFVDIGEYPYNMLDTGEVKDLDGVVGMIFVHMYGRAGDFISAIGLVDEHDLWLIEDAAQALGASYQGYSVGSVGDISCLSFDPAKVISAVGSGGAILTDSPEMAEKIRQLRYHNKPDYQGPGYNSQMSELSAALLSAKLLKADDWQMLRAHISHKYFVGLNDLPLSLPRICSLEAHNWHKFVIKLKNSYARLHLKEHLLFSKVGVRVHYSYILPHLFGFSGEWPNAEDLSRTCLSLPIHPFLTMDEVDKVIRLVRSYWR